MPLAVVAVLLLSLAAWGQQGSQDLDAKIKEIDQKLAELQQLKTELETLRDEVVGAPGVEKKPGWQDKVKLTGYFHARSTYRDWDVDSFDLRRMYITLIGKPTDKATAVVTWARIGTDALGQTNTDWATAYVDYQWSPEWATRFGQGANSFGLETGQSSSQRLGLDRAAVLEGGQGRPLGLYFAGPWDRGLWVMRKPQSGSMWDPEVVLGVLNGQFRNTEKDQNKTWTLDLKWHPTWGQFGASYLTGRWVNDMGLPAAPTGSTDRRAILGYARWDPPGSSWALQGEYTAGELFGNDICGWYGQLEYDPYPQGTAYAKYERYDPTQGTGGGEYDSWHLGFAHWVDSNNELTLQYSMGTNRQAATHPRRNELALQWQAGF